MTEAPSGACEALVAQARLRDICAQLHRSGWFIALTDGLMAWLVARNGAPWSWLAPLWWCLAVAAPLYRRRVAARYAPLDGPAVLPALAHMERLSALVGAVRALIVLLAFGTGDENTQYLMTLIVIGLAAGATATSGGSVRSMVLWGWPVFAVLAGCWIARASWVDGLIALLMLLLFRVLVGYVRTLGAQQRQLIETAEALRVERDRVQSVNQSISLLVDQLREERDRAAAANETKTRFLASASHDLRQPLYALGLNSTTLDDLAARRDDAQLQRVSDGIRRSLQQSRDLLDSLLDMSKLEAQAVEVRWESLDLALFVAALSQPYEAQAREKGLAFVAPSAAQRLWVRSDRTQLARLVGNLLHNAVKFTAHGHVGVRFVAQADSVAVEVFDTGPGIPADERSRVFEEFYQLENPGRDRSRGLGLGLSIVRLLATLLEARVELEAEDGGGCRFRVSLPRTNEAPASAAPAAAAIAAAGARRRVLVIDDEAEILQAVATMLTARGWDVATARDSSQALERMAGEGLPHVLLVDYRLGTETGLQAILAVQARLGVALPAVIVTGDTAPQRIIETNAAGYPVLHKPIDGQAVERALASALAGGSV